MTTKPIKPAAHLNPAERARWTVLNKQIATLAAQLSELRSERTRLDSLNRTRGRYRQLGKADRYARAERAAARTASDP